jgi:ketosteroid isomerase-like protein
MSNTQIVQSIYEAFGRGDIPAILERLHPDVEWEHDMVAHGIPWVTPRKGRAGVVQFFEGLQGLDFHVFEPFTLLEGPGQVMGLIRLEATVRATGKRVKDLEAHLFTFDDAGRITRFRHFVDTHQHLLASQA